MGTCANGKNVLQQLAQNARIAAYQTEGEKMKLKIDGNKIILPCKPGDTYYTIERIAQTERRICEGRGLYNCVMENTKTVGKEIVEHKWHSYAEIVQALEVGRIGKSVFLKREVAESKFEKYWEKWWGKRENK